MSEYTHILVAVDFSKSAGQVLTRACNIALRDKAKLSLLHVVEYMPPIDFTGEPLLVNNWVVDEEAMLEHARKSLQDLSKKHNLKDAQLVVRIGTPKHEISSFVKDQLCDLVIMGSHGRHGLSLLLGSTANSVLHAMPCDILTIKIAE